MLTVSIVLYKTDRRQINSVLDCVLNSVDADGDYAVDKVYLVDNSPDDGFKDYGSYASNITYIFNNANIGYGAAHNIALHRAIEDGSAYHLILNPDIRFEKDVLNKCTAYLDRHRDTGYLIPKVTYPDGELQYLCKLLPKPSDLIFRRFVPSVGLFKGIKLRMNDKYVLKNFGYDGIINPPCLSGCFMLLRCETLKKNNIFFDERFFMYCEDFDFIRRLHRVARTVFYPCATIVHDHARESYKNKKMLRQHIRAAVTYFNKYGWFFDKERKEMNNQIIAQLAARPATLAVGIGVEKKGGGIE